MREQLQLAVKKAEAALAAANKALFDFDSAPENNAFDDLEKASGVIEDKLREQAHNDCEGSYNCGQDEYRQEFIVNGERYVGILSCEYNRHDKTYYYLEESTFEVEKL